MFRAPHFIKICRQAKCKNGLLKMKHMGKRCKMDDNEFDPSARKVPSNNFERALGFASLAAKVAFNGLAEGVKKGISGEEINFKK
ncbi:hypothetical protein MHBO_003861 [Bonamia ostreae]|uniref:Uncharacterized protein n=1 Tax=Bonamia ostreae TaxID=126728 RepID=A0ABV2ARQ5_9EUKA